MSKDKPAETIVDLDAPGSPAIAPEDGLPDVVDEDVEATGRLPPRAAAGADGTVTLPLREPVTLQIRSQARGSRDEVFSELTFSRLTGAHMRQVMAASRETQPIVMLACATRLSQPVMNALFDKMDAADIADAAKICDHFFGSGRTAGR